ncbi:MAG: tyrosine-type recombinase/integrase [Thermoplasmata archaeon]|nr:tyrosine-type recombinase/integrase [Thermoplasmata archaeon]
MNIEGEWLEMTKDHKYYTPTTRRNAARYLRRWQGFLDSRKRRFDRVKVEDFEDFEDFLISEGKKLTTVSTIQSYVVMFYSLKANKNKHSRWPGFVSQLKAHKRPKVRTAASPHKPYPLDVIPEILDAAREVEGDAFPVVAGFIYTGMRAQMYGIRVDELHFEDRVLTPLVKGAHRVRIPFHRCLIEIWKDHLEKRGYDGPMLFRLGKHPYKFLEGEGGDVEWFDDEKNMKGNRWNVARLLGKVEEVLRDRGIDEHLTGHRFRKSVGTYASQFGMDKTERRVLLAHEAKDIMDVYDMRDIQNVGAHWDGIDLGSREWVKAGLSSGTPTVVSGPNGNGDVVATLQALRLELVKTLDPSKRAVIEPLFEGFEKSLTALLNGA